MRSPFGFPNPVDEISARLVAGGVVVLAATFLLTGNRLVLAALAYGFLARVCTGPKLSPLGRLVTQVVRPALPAAPRLVPGPPKRFAQGIGATFTMGALVLALAGAGTAAAALIAVLLVFATLEAMFAFCMGCIAFGWLMQAGVIPDDICADCAEISRRIDQGASVG